MSAFSSMDRIRGFEPCDVGSIPAGPTIPLRVVQRIEPGPPKT